MDTTVPVPSEEERQRSYALLKQQVAERTRALSTLLSVQQAITSRLETQEVLQMIADGARLLTGSLFAGVYLLDGENMHLAVMSVAIDQPEIQARPANISTGYSIPIGQSLAKTAVQQ